MRTFRRYFCPSVVVWSGSEVGLFLGRTVLYTSVLGRIMALLVAWVPCHHRLCAFDSVSAWYINKFIFLMVSALVGILFLKLNMPIRQTSQHFNITCCLASAALCKAYVWIINLKKKSVHYNSIYNWTNTPAATAYTHKTTALHSLQRSMRPTHVR